MNDAHKQLHNTPNYTICSTKLHKYTVNTIRNNNKQFTQLNSVYTCTKKHNKHSLVTHLDTDSLLCTQLHNQHKYMNTQTVYTATQYRQQRVELHNKHNDTVA